MSLFEKKYTITGWRGDEYSLTAKKLYERVMKDSESDYNWIASATELVRVCKQLKFPETYAQEIQIAILNCFANLETKKEIGSHQEPTDADAVNFCYNSLADVSEEANKARQKYLKAVIGGVTKYHFGPLEFIGPTYCRICEEWEEVKFEEYGHMSSLDFTKLRKVLDDEFDKTIRTADQDAFQKDEDEFWSSFKVDAFWDPGDIYMRLDDN